MGPNGAALGGRIARWFEYLSLGALAALLITLPFWRHRVLLHRPNAPIFFEFLDITLYTNDLLWLATLGSWLLSLLLRRELRRLRLGPWFLFGPLAGLLVLGLVGIPFAVDRWYAGYQFVRLLLLLGLYLEMVNASIPPGLVAWPLAAGMIIQAAVGLPQFLLGRSLGLQRLGEVTIDAAWPGASVVMVGEQRWLRAYGLVQHPNLLGGCLMVMLLVVTGYYLSQSGWRRIPLLAALASGLVTLLLTFSRAAWLGTLLGGLVMIGLLLWARRQRQWAFDRRALRSLALVSASVVFLFAAANWRLLQPRLGLTSQGVEIRSVDARMMQVQAAFSLIEMRPLLGVGLGNFPIALYQLAQETVAAYPVYQPVHNVFLLISAELGLFGGLLWAALIVAPWLALWLRRRQVRLASWWAGLSGALAAISLVSVLDFYVWSSHQGSMMLWLSYGLWAREWLHGTQVEVQR